VHIDVNAEPSAARTLGPGHSPYIPHAMFDLQMLPYVRWLSDRVTPLRVQDSATCVALTFDLEPRPDAIRKREFLIGEEYEAYLDEMLGLLRTFKVKADFFVPGKTMLLNKELLRRILRDGHGVGGHGYEHETMSGLGFREQVRVISKTKASYESLTDRDSLTWRSPMLLSGLDTYRALRSCGVRLSSSTEAISHLTVIGGVVEIPLVSMDGEYLSYSSPSSWRGYVRSVKSAVLERARQVLVFGFHPWLQMEYDPKLEGLHSLLSWLGDRGARAAIVVTDLTGIMSRIKVR
jgi:peptidoglycan/xylan/chitin deacetylase (PgdA/CDA1 family)